MSSSLILLVLSRYSILTAVVSVSCFTILVVSWIAAWLCTLVSLKTIEYSLTGQWRDSIYLSNLLSMVSPLMTLCAMASPLVQVTRAVRIGSPDHGLQTHLIGAFLSCGLLGVAYGWRVGLKSVLISNSFSILLQCTSLAGIYYLWPLRQSNILAVLFKWLIFVALLLTYGLGVFCLSMKLPLHTALTPLFTLSCVLPYCATFSTFPRDLNAFRTWYARPDRSSSSGPKGVDLFTLSVMQINNCLWLSYGTLIRDPVRLTKITHFAGHIHLVHRRSMCSSNPTELIFHAPSLCHTANYLVRRSH